uniref:hypothetical protein n=1 Tax=Salmonella enterica TaxID=28901 RepID=UPI00398C6514
MALKDWVHGERQGRLEGMDKGRGGKDVTPHEGGGWRAQGVGSAAITGQAMAMVSRTATRRQENVGQSVDETIRQVKRLRDEPGN